MLFEDWWLRPDGAVKQMGQSEHAEEALRVLLKLPDDFRIPKTALFSGITQKTEDSARARGVADNVLAYLSRDEIDPRTWMIQKEGWIRISKNKMNLWMFNQSTLDLIRNSAYWQHQIKASPYDMIEIDELSTNERFEVPVRALRSRASNAEALKEIGLRRGEFPHGEEIEETLEESAPYLARPGGYTDKPGDKRWLYQSVGGNPPKGKAVQPNEEEQGFGVQEFRVFQGPTFRDDHTYKIVAVFVPHPGEAKNETQDIGRIFRDMDQFQDFGRWYDADEDDSQRGTPKLPVGFSMEEAVHKMFDRFLEKSNNPGRRRK